MMFAYKLLIIIFLSFNLFANQVEFNSVELSKIKNLINKEEQIASAYKKFLIEKGRIPNVTNLIDEKYLPEGFSLKTLFGKNIELNDTDLKAFNNINNLPNIDKLKSTSIDEYFSSKNRVHTKNALAVNTDTRINLSTEEKLIYTLITASEITKEVPATNEMYQLDDDGVLHWYSTPSKLEFSYSKLRLILYDNVDSSLTIKAAALNELFANDMLTAGLVLYNYSDGIAYEYLNIANDGTLIKTGYQGKDIGKTLIQFTRRAGGVLVNGDLYTWGNTRGYGVSLWSGNDTMSIGKDNNDNPVNSQGAPIVNVLVKAKPILDMSIFGLSDDEIDDLSEKDFKYYSSPLRPKFIDFSSTVFHGTCGITTNGELYCGGDNVLDNNYIDFTGYSRRTKLNQELLYKSVFFDGSSTEKSAVRIFPLESTYLVLNKKGDVYYWGNGDNMIYNGTGSKQRNVRTPTKMSTIGNVKLKDISLTLSINYRRIFGLSVNGEIYSWGKDYKSTGSGRPDLGECIQEIEDEEGNKEEEDLCKPLKLESDIYFTSILSGQQTIMAKDSTGLFYRISQPKGKRPIADNVNELIKEHTIDGISDYDEVKDQEILSADISSKLNGSDLELGQGIVWVNGENELKGDYFTVDNKNDEFFIQSIAKIKWKIIRVIEDQNGMCGINTVNQMYCWGRMQFGSTTSTTSRDSTTFMLPIFNMNLHDLDKDYMVVENNPTTPMTSSPWLDSDGNYFVKYPTYVGGFNYEFEFK